MSDHKPLRLRQEVRVTPLEAEHAPSMFRWMCDPVVSVNLGLRSEPSMQKTSAWIESAVADETIEPFAVLLNDLHVGNVVLDRIDHYLGTARLSVYIGQAEARGAGIATTGMYLTM